MSSLQNTSGRKLRSQLFIAPRAQGRLMYRAMLHVVLSSAATGLACVAFMSLSNLSDGVAVVAAVSLVSLIAIPVTLIETARTSNEVLGPFVRVQGSIRQLAYGDRVSKLAIRDGDMWQEWMHEFNAMLEQIQRKPPSGFDGASASGCGDSSHASHPHSDEMSVR